MSRNGGYFLAHQDRISGPFSRHASSVRDLCKSSPAVRPVQPRVTVHSVTAPLASPFGRMASLTKRAEGATFEHGGWREDANHGGRDD